MSNKYNVAIYDLEGNFITSTFGIEEASNLTGADRNLISCIVNGKNTKGNDFQFRRFEKEPIRKIGNVLSIVKGMDQRPVAKYFEDKLICVYNSIREAESKTKIDVGSIHQSCTDKCRAGIFNFKFI